MREKLLTPKKQYQWWAKGGCTVELVKRGHFPTTSIVILPNGKTTEIDLEDLE